MSLSEFIDTCLKLDSSNDMKVIVEKKVKKHFNLCNINYTSSQEFQDLLKEKIALLEKKPEEMFIVIKDVVDELRMRKFKVSSEPPVKKLKVDADSSQTENVVTDETEESAVMEKPKHEPRILKKLKKLLLILHKKISKLEAKEVNWDDDNDSTYIQLQRYRDRIVAVYQKINEYEGCSTNVNKLDYMKISFSGTQFPKVNNSIEKFVNKTGQFPDYRDILKILQETCKEEKISINQARLNNMAKSAFQEIGEQMQRKRQFEFWNSHSLYLGTNEDPANGDVELEQKLQENKAKYGGKILEVIDKYAEEAVKQKLEPEEVPDDLDKSADEKSEEGESEDTEEEVEEDDNNYIDNVISDNKKATSSCEEISDNEDSDASGEVVCDEDMWAGEASGGHAEQEVSEMSPSKEEVREMSPAKEEVSAMSPAKEEVSAMSPAKEEVSAMSPAKEEVSAMSPAKEEVSAMSPAKEEVSAMSPSKEEIDCENCGENCRPETDAKDDLPQSGETKLSGDGGHLPEPEACSKESNTDYCDDDDAVIVLD